MLKSFTFNYSGGAQTWTAPCNGKYRLECWGAQGGNTEGYIGGYGGYGGYAKGDINLIKGQKIYIYVGQKGTDGGHPAYAFNGGGYGASDTCGASGSGSSDIRINATDLKNRIIVAGGGGGASGDTPLGNGGYGAVGSTGGCGGGGSSYLGTLENSSTVSGINTGDGKVVITLMYDEFAFFLKKGEEYYLPIAKYFDTGTKMFKAVSLNDLRSEINNSNYGNVGLYNINTPFVINSISYNPLDYLDISKCKICVIPNGSRTNEYVKELDINYIPTNKALSRTSIKIKEMYTPYKDNTPNPFLNVEAANKANISYIINYENIHEIVSDDCSLIDKKLIKDNFYLSFKLNDAISLLKSVSLCSRDINYFKIIDDDLNVSNDYINTQIAFEKEYSEILINRLTKQYFKYLDDNLDTF
ncbi:glycine rich domain-containing protein [Clostridium sp. YIM B02555]|uniref:glycine rich domain-containing protein n=1 Tax=Clostridium sp. YIM B02555 TaxID=2911968 RepID=UPI001EEF17EB|nr:glycine rich domain-containing protein [Clostridium sp. YIM B02555]